MADQDKDSKNLPASERRLEKARQEGQVPRSRDLTHAAAIAQIAHANAWQSPVEGAISFHATRVSPGWRMKRVATLGNHVFYR